MKLTNFNGENIERAISLLRGTERSFKNATMGGPTDGTKWMFDIIQTSSVEAFDCQFAL
jgi:hypothetical protein